MLGKKSDYKGFFDTLYKRLKRKSLLFVISDFVGEIDLALLSKKHDVVALIIRDKFEEKPSELGYIRVLDMESSKSFEGNIGSAEVKSYEKSLAENDAKLYAHFKKNAVRFTKIYTDEEPYLRLVKLLGGR